MPAHMVAERAVLQKLGNSDKARRRLALGFPTSFPEKYLVPRRTWSQRSRASLGRSA